MRIVSATPLDVSPSIDAIQSVGGEGRRARPFAAEPAQALPPAAAAVDMEGALAAAEASRSRRMQARSGRDARTSTTSAWETAAPAVSVVIPSYGQAAFVAEAVESAVAAVGVPIEIVVIDDGSADGSAELVRTLLAAHDEHPLKLVQLADNGGVAAARNRGFEEARAQSVLLLDADDALLPHGPSLFTSPCRRIRMPPSPTASSPASASSRDLLGTAPWDPALFRHGNYVPVSVLARAAVRLAARRRLFRRGPAGARVGGHGLLAAARAAAIGTARRYAALSGTYRVHGDSISTIANRHAGALQAFMRAAAPRPDGRRMTPDELLTHLEAELARCRDERDRLRAELEAAIADRDRAASRRPSLGQDAADAAGRARCRRGERDWLYGELDSVLGSKSWLLTRPSARICRAPIVPKTAGRPVSDGAGSHRAGSVTLVLISRTGERHPRRRGAGADLRRPRRRGDPRDRALAPEHSRASQSRPLVFPPAAPWGDVIAACVEAATGERIVFVELPAVQSLARVMQLLDELDYARRRRRAPAPARRRHARDALAVASAAARHAVALESGTIASTLLPASGGRCSGSIGARLPRAAMRFSSPDRRTASVGDVLAEADWGWRLSLRGHRVICSPILIPIDEGVGPPRTRRRSTRKVCVCVRASPCSRRCSSRRSTARWCRIRPRLDATRMSASSGARSRHQSPSAATRASWRSHVGIVRLAEPDLRERRAAAQTARTRDDAALAKRLGTAFDVDR